MDTPETVMTTRAPAVLKKDWKDKNDDDSVVSSLAKGCEMRGRGLSAPNEA